MSAPTTSCRASMPRCGALKRSGGTTGRVRLTATDEKRRWHAESRDRRANERLARLTDREQDQHDSDQEQEHHQRQWIERYAKDLIVVGRTRQPDERRCRQSQKEDRDRD